MKYAPETRRLAATFLLLTTVCAGLLAAQAPPAEPSPAIPTRTIDANDPALRRISSRLQCQCGGCTASVQTCPHQMDCGLRMYILNTIKTGLAAGKTEDQIVAAIAAEYGPKILLEPPREGFALLGWVMPFLALLAGAAAVGLVLWRWKASGQQEPAASAEPAAPLQPPAQAVLVDKYREQIDRELES
jgi:cytochrome c-type biogenesis protein CcmH/NrfF